MPSKRHSTRYCIFTQSGTHCQFFKFLSFEEYVLYTLCCSRTFLFSSFYYALQIHCTKNLKLIFPERKLRGLVPNLYIHVSVSDSCTPTIGPQTQYSKIGGPIEGIYKSITDTWIQKLGTRPRSFHVFISGNICFEFSVQCLQEQSNICIEKVLKRTGAMLV